VATSCPWPWQTPECPPECYCDFYGAYYATDEVYVFRAVVKLPASIDSTSQAMLFAKAFGEATLGTNPLDVRGVTVLDLGGGSYQVEIVYTTSDAGVPLAQKGDVSLTQAIDASPALRDEFPGMKVSGGRRLQLLDAGSVAYWLSVPIVWRAGAGPTQAYGRGDNVWLGTAAQRQAQMKPKDPTPVGTKPPTSVGGLDSTALLGAAAIAAVLWLAFTRRKRTRRIAR
jgi:hypothetical protein